MTRQIHIDPSFKALIPPLSAEEFAGLEADIVAAGCRDPLVIAKWSDGEALADGHNRLEICTRLKLPFERVTRIFRSRADAALWIRENQLARRNLPDDVRAIISDEIREARSKLAVNDRARKASAAAHGVLSHTPCDKAKRDTRAEVAAENKVSRRKLSYAQELREKAPELARRVRAGATTLLDAMRALRQAAKREAVENLATLKAKEVAGLFDVIVIDPPWPEARIGIAESRLDSDAPLDYPVITVKEIEKLVGDQLAQHAFGHCHVFLWTTQKFLPAAFGLLEAWGLRYGFCMTWHKVNGPKPLDLPTFNSEFVVYARKGSPKFIETKNFFTSFHAERTAHSEKPEEFYETLRRVTGGRRLDMFNRRRIQGFLGWGIEAPPEEEIA